VDELRERIRQKEEALRREEAEKRERLCLLQARIREIELEGAR